ncbi:hypothetical protein [Paenibacillus uliginis]|nr:hypothetical protein [Paenibacillus uliginis]
MMKIKTFGLLMIILLSGCSSLQFNQNQTHTIIDWVDFVKLNGNMYTSDWGIVLKHENDVAEEVGEVSFTVDEVVTDPGYRTKDGDAAFLDIGTKLYRVKGFGTDELIAVADDTRVNGYKLYIQDQFRSSMINRYDEIPKDKVNSIGLYCDNESKPYKTLTGKDINKFIKLLDDGVYSPNYSPNMNNGDPLYYLMVFYTDDPIGNSFSIADDSQNVYFYPDSTRIVDSEIRDWIEQ